MDQLFYDLLGLVGFAHPLHPVLITMVVGPVIASFLFAAVAFFFKKPEFYKTSRQLTVIGFIFWFPTVAVGIIDWMHFYGGSTKMVEISIKLVLAGLLFLVLLGNILLFKKGQEKPLLPLIFTLLGTLMVSALGFYGGEIVFGGNQATAAPAATAPVTATPLTDGIKTVSQDGYKMSWKIHDNAIDVTVSYAANGWVGVGFGKTGTMEGSHIILGFALEGKGTVVDHFGYAKDRHGPQDKVGGKDVLTARDATFADGVTTITFSMPLNDGNAKDPVLVEGETYKVILASGGDDSNDLETYHGKKGRIVLDVKL
ncbi:MAG: DOMON domain-containing protein [Spirochaetales bacterium]